MALPGEESLNYICILSVSARLKIAEIALGNKAILSVSFYTSLHQKALEEKNEKSSECIAGTECIVGSDHLTEPHISRYTVGLN